MLVDFVGVKNIFIVCGRTDILKGIDGLASIVQCEYNVDLSVQQHYFKKA